MIRTAQVTGTACGHIPPLEHASLLAFLPSPSVAQQLEVTKTQRSNELESEATCDGEEESSATADM